MNCPTRQFIASVFTEKGRRKAAQRSLAEVAFENAARLPVWKAGDIFLGAVKYRNVVD
jgi:hypothetical protein